MKKLVIRSVLGIVLLVIVVAVAAVLMIDHLAKIGIEKGGTFAMGTPTTVEKVNLGLASGQLTIDTLQINNPQGFSSPHFMKSGKFDVALKLASITTDVVELTKFELDGLDVNIEQKDGKSNVNVLMDHVKQLGGEKKPEAEKKSEGGKNVKVDRVVIRNVTANLHFALLGSQKKVTVKIPSLELKGVSSDNPKGISIGDLFAQLTPAILASVVENAKNLGAGVVPADLLNGLNGDISGATKALGDKAAKLLGQLGGSGTGGSIVPKDVNKAVEDIGKNLGGALKPAGTGTAPAQNPAKDIEKNVGGALGGLLGGKAASQPAK